MKKAYLDIETTGLRRTDKVTVVGIYDPSEEEVIQLIKDRDLYSKTLNEQINRFKEIITFNGKRFDIPFLKRRYDIDENFNHTDVCLIKSKIGLKGGLKTIEKKLGVCRDEEIGDLRGGDAPKLWKDYEVNGNKTAMKKLLKYNEADLKKLHEVHRIIEERIKNSSE